MFRKLMLMIASLVIIISFVFADENQISQTQTQNTNINYEFGVIFIYDMLIESDYFISKSTESALAIEQKLAQHFENLKTLKEFSNNKPITIAINPEILSFINKNQNFFKEMPASWNFLIYPCYNAKIDLLASKNLNIYLNNLIEKSINLPFLSMWHIAISFKNFSQFFKQTLPVGIISDIDFFDENVFKVCSVRDFEILVNIGNFKNYEPVIFTNNSKHIAMLFENISLELPNNKNEVSFKDIYKIFDNNIKNINKNNYDAVFVFRYNKIVNNVLFEYELTDFYKKLFKNNINSLVNLQQYLMQKPQINTFKIIDILQQDFIIDLNKVISYFNTEEKIKHWGNFSIFLNQIDGLKNKGALAQPIYQETMNILYLLNSRIFLKLLNFSLNENFDKTTAIYQDLLTKISTLLDIKQPNSSIQSFVQANTNTIQKLPNGLSISDATGDDYGDGTYIQPANETFVKSSLDILNVLILNKPESLAFDFKFKTLNIETLQLDVYIDLNGRRGLGNTELLPNRKAFTAMKNAWEYAISINSNKAMLYQAGIDGGIMEVARLDYTLDVPNNSLQITIPNKLLSGNVMLWNYIILTCLFDKKTNKIVDVEYQNSTLDPAKKIFYSGRQNDFQSNIIDLICSKNSSQEMILKTKDNIVEISAIGEEN